MPFLSAMTCSQTSSSSRLRRRITMNRLVTRCHIDGATPQLYWTGQTLGKGSRTKCLDPLSPQPVRVEILERPFSVTVAEGCHVILCAPLDASGEMVHSGDFEVRLRNVNGLRSSLFSPMRGHKRSRIPYVLVHWRIIRGQDRQTARNPF